jgi:hypothetical protein
MHRASLSTQLGTCASQPGCDPASTIPGPRQNPPVPLSAAANASVAQFIWVGSQDTVSPGKYFTAAPNEQVVFTDHGRDEPGTWKCPQ